MCFLRVIMVFDLGSESGVSALRPSKFKHNRNQQHDRFQTYLKVWIQNPRTNLIVLKWNSNYISICIYVCIYICIYLYTPIYHLHRVLLPWKSGWKNLSVYMEVVYVQFLGKKWNCATGPANAEKLTVNLLHGSSSSDMPVTYSSWKCENWD